VKKGDKLDTAVKAAYKVNSNLSTALTFNQLGKVSIDSWILALHKDLTKPALIIIPCKKGMEFAWSLWKSAQVVGRR
jgi:hypothetical protein